MTVGRRRNNTMRTRLFYLLVLASLVMAACGPVAATEAPPAAAPTGAVAAATQAGEAPAAAATEAVDPVVLALQLADKAARGESVELSGESGVTIGIVMPALDNDGWRAIYIGALGKAIELGANVITLDARDKVENQLAMIEDMITQEVDAIVFVPVDSAAMSAAVVKANEAGIPVIAMDRSTQGGDVAALVESNNVEIGRTGADLMAEVADEFGVAIEDLKILELLGDLATSAGQERHEGFSTRGQELGFNVVAELPTYWQADKANAAVLDAFAANPDINAIYMASGCAMYTGVESAMRSLGNFIPRDEVGHIMLISTDGCPAPLEAMRGGYVDADSAQQLLTMGMEAIAAAFAAAQGGAPESPIIRLGPDPIRPDNVDDPFHWANAINTAY